MTRAQLEELVQWMGGRMYTPSRFLYPMLQDPTISVFKVLDKIHEITGIDKEKLGTWLEDGRKEE